MPGPVSDSYDPEFGTGENARDVAEALAGVLTAISNTLPNELKNVVQVVHDKPGKRVQIHLSERDRRLIRFAINRALESI